MKSRCIAFLLIFFISWHAAAGSNNNDLAVKLKEHVGILASDSLQGRGLGTRGSDLAREYISTQFSEMGLGKFGDDYFQHFETRIGLAWVPAMNIIGYIEGSDPGLKDEYIVVGAHYDHLGFTRSNDQKTIFPGADDNASGVAGMIEIARFFSENQDKPGRSLIFIAFDAEESGLLGAHHFVKNSPVSIEQVRLMFSLDMIGMYAANNGVRLGGMGTLENGAEMAMIAASDHGIVVRSANNRIERRTDTAPFGDAGIPAAHVFTGMKSPYHKPQDTHDLLDYEGMANIVRFMNALLLELSLTPDLTPIPRLLAEAEARQSGRRKKAEIGLVLNNGSGFHRYRDEFFRANSLYTVSAGLYSILPISRILALQPEALYDFNGSHIEGGKFRRHSVTMPVNIRLSTPGGDFSPSLFLITGPYYRYSFAGKSTGESIDFKNQFERGEWGMNAGIGVQVFKFQVSFTSRRGFTNIARGQDLKLYDSGNYFSFSYRF